MTTTATRGFGIVRPRARTLSPAPRPVDFRAIVGEGQWARLPAAVQARFCVAAGLVPHAYEGRMIVRANLAGLAMAQALRLVGAPLAPWRGEAVPVRVDVHGDPKGGLVWDRTYAFAGRAPTRVSSRKVMDEQGALMEVVRCGLGMRLQLTVRAGALHFRSQAYFVEIAGVRVSIPALLTPGRALITHEDQGAGWFRFTLSFRHRMFGETFYQTGLFREA